MANPLRRVFSSSQVRDWSSVGSGTILTPSRKNNLFVTYLVIGGGGGGCGGGGGSGAGGGAGGFQTGTVDVVRNQIYTVTVGAGGPQLPNSTPGSFGSPSQFTAMSVSSAGGGGGSANNFTSGDGGSGGGGHTGSAGGIATPSGQGNNGGNGTFISGGNAAGGGGGAGGPGKDAPFFNVGGDGGPGATSNITGGLVTYAGGGAGAGNGLGGRGGIGGGGNGGADFNPTNQPGAINSGSGGGGQRGSASAPVSPAGGSGIVILSILPNLTTIIIGPGLVYTSGTNGLNTYYSFTAGTGTVSFT